ncbi:hypothetical protein HGM15179_020578 [Zosterops borbonicus]|uniref:Reverse transcriptase thumb domain-containing protein n=1 Tax=Zosterops borbonicus TaxID=364589 RepID=A0A8K1D9G3_9PASS|nr:hypothetical protein HGM15179_020578 [Zosterops borbonicus]
MINAVIMKQTGLWTLKGVLQSEKAGGHGQRPPWLDCSGEELEDSSMESGERKLPGNRLRKKYAAVSTLEKRLLWQVDWERRVEAAMTENLGLSQGDPGQFTTPDMMLGKGPFAAPQAQAQLHAAILQQSQNLAKEAFHAVPDMGLLSPSYTTIKQEAKGTFMSFLDHLRDAIDRVPGMSPDVKTALGMQLAMENGNSTYAQRLIGDIQWIRRSCDITNEDLEPLMPLLKGGNHANLLRKLTEKQQKALTQIATKLGNSFADCWSPALPLSVAVLNREAHVMAILMQWDSQAKQPLKILEWVFLPFNLNKSLTMRMEAIAKIVIKTCVINLV